MIGLCMILAFVLFLSSCTEDLSLANGGETDSKTQMTEETQSTENNNTVTLETIKSVEPQTPGKVSGVPVEQSPDVFDDIVKRDSILKGKSISFESDSKTYVGQREDKFNPKFIIINSTSELTDANIMIFGTEKDAYANVDKYNENFFKENILIYLFRNSVNSDIINKIYLFKNDNEICFNLIFSYGDPALSLWRSFIIVKKSDVSDVNNWSMFVEYCI